MVVVTPCPYDPSIKSSTLGQTSIALPRPPSLIYQSIPLYGRYIYRTRYPQIELNELYIIVVTPCSYNPLIKFQGGGQISNGPPPEDPLSETLFVCGPPPGPCWEYWLVGYIYNLRLKCHLMLSTTTYIYIHVNYKMPLWFLSYPLWSICYQIRRIQLTGVMLESLPYPSSLSCQSNCIIVTLGFESSNRSPYMADISIGRHTPW